MGNDKDPSFEYNKSYAQTRGLPYIPGTNIRTGHPDPSRSSDWHGPPNTPAHKASQYQSTRTGCFPAGTPIDTPDGPRDIAVLRAGDTVRSMDTRTGRFHSREVLNVRTYPPRRLWRVQFTSGAALRTTAVHSFRVGDGWRRAIDLRPGDRVLGIDAQGRREERVVVRSYATADLETVYNLVVDEDFTFVASGALTSSFTFARGLRSTYWRLAMGVVRAAGRMAGARSPAAAAAGRNGLVG